jgi:DNA-binding PadR family transcriptional regulator
LNAEEAQLLYAKAQSIAEEKELEFMARKISAEHDFLIDQLDLWKKFTTKLPSILEILELTRIEDMLNQMLRKGVIFPSEVEQKDEEPSLIIILTESGEILFTEKITKTIEDELIARIHPEIRTRIEEELEFEIIKRGRLYDYSYIIKKADSLFFCYFFIGKSYQAIKRLDEFSKILSETSTIWNQLVTISKTDLQLNFEERRSITSFIDDIFLASK